MPWSEKSIMLQRHEFVMLFEQEGVNRRELCRRFGVSPTIGYRLLARWRADGKAGLTNRSRRPQHSPGRSSPAMESLVLAVRDEHPAWGGRKIRRRLQDLKHQAVPSASTITAVLHRHGRLEPAAGTSHKPFERFERAAPNELWQMDYKGHFATHAGRCHPLTVVDDHSRYAIGLRACGDERAATVQGRADRDLSALRAARAHADGQWRPVGVGCRAPSYLADGMAARAWCGGQPRPALPSANPRQGRAVSSYPDGRGDRPARLYRSWRVPAPV